MLLLLVLSLSIYLSHIRYCYNFTRMVYHALFVVRCNLLQDTLNQKPSYDTVFFMSLVHTAVCYKEKSSFQRLMPKNLQNLFSIVTYVPQVAKSSPMHTKYFRNHILPGIDVSRMTTFLFDFVVLCSQPNSTDPSS